MYGAAASVRSAPEYRTLVGSRLSAVSIPVAPNASSRWSYPKVQRRLLVMVATAPEVPRSTITAPSMSPASFTKSATRLVPVAWTSTMSPRKNRAMSKSWIVMSRNRPPEAPR